MRWILKILCIAALAAVIGCSQSSCQSSGNEEAGGDWPYTGPIVDETGQQVQAPDWGN